MTSYCKALWGQHDGQQQVLAVIVDGILCILFFEEKGIFLCRCVRLVVGVTSSGFFLFLSSLQRWWWWVVVLLSVACFFFHCGGT